MRTVPTLMALLLLPGIAAQAQTKKPAARPAAVNVKKTPPPLAPAPPLRLPPIVQETLPNGLRLVLLEDHRQPAVWMRLALPAGSIRDPQEKVGLAAMTAGMLDKGTATRSESEIADTVDGLGASLGASAGDDYLTVSASGLSAQTDTLLTLLADIALRPVFPTEEIERYRARTINQVNAALAEAATLADAAIARRVYGAHPYGNLSSGTARTLPGITQADLKAFHETFFAPNVATLFLVGDITRAQARERAEAAFGTWRRREVPPPPAPPAVAAAAATPRLTIIDRPGASQTEIRIGTLAPPYNSPTRITGVVATTVLGLGNFEGRLTREIRVKRGLTYGAASFFARNAQAGMFQMTTYTKNESTAEVIRIALAEARRLTREPTPPGELQPRKSFLSGLFAVSVATPDGILQRLIPAVLNGGGPEDLTRYIPRVQSATPAQIQEVVRSLPLGSPEIVLVGDAKAIEAQVRPLGRVTRIAAENLDLLSPTLIAAPSPTSASATPATPEEATEGRARLDATVKAHGGDAFLNARTLVLSGKGEVTPPGQAGAGMALPVDSVTLTAVPPDKSRLELKTPFGDVVFGAPGGGAGGWINAMGNVQNAPPGGMVSVDPADLLRRAIQKGYALRPLPEGALKGFAITDEKGQVSQVFTDPQTGLVRRVATKTAQGEMVFLVGDYKATDGVQLPSTLQVLQNGAPFLRLTFTRFVLNQPVDDAVFARPKP